MATTRMPVGPSRATALGKHGRPNCTRGGSPRKKTVSVHRLTRSPFIHSPFVLRNSSFIRHSLPRHSSFHPFVPPRLSIRLKRPRVTPPPQRQHVPTRPVPHPVPLIPPANALPALDALIRVHQHLHLVAGDPPGQNVAAARRLLATLQVRLPPLHDHPRPAQLFVLRPDLRLAHRLGHDLPPPVHARHQVINHLPAMRQLAQRRQRRRRVDLPPPLHVRQRHAPLLPHVRANVVHQVRRRRRRRRDQIDRRPLRPVVRRPPRQPHRQPHL